MQRRGSAGEPWRNSRQAASGLHNLYGPTEAAVDVTLDLRRRRIRRSADRPSDSEVKTSYWMREMNPTPIGVAAELYLGGVAWGEDITGKAGSDG